MPRVSLPIGFSFYQSDSLPFSAQRCVNWIPTAAESASATGRKLSQPLGLKILADSATGVNRGALVMSEVPYFVNGKTLVSISRANVITQHGAISGSGRVSMATNGRYLVVVVPGQTSYAFDNTNNTLTAITDPDFRASDSVVYKDGYFVFSASDGSVFFNSALNDPFSFDGLDFGTAEINPDRITGLHVNHNELFVSGFDTIELFQNIGGSGFPFQRIPGANIQKGVRAPFSMVEFDNTFCFVGGGLNEKPAIWKVTGSSSAQKISTDAIDQVIQKYTEAEIESAFALTFSDRGQHLALFTFESTTTPSRTFVYNATASAYTESKVWFELQTGTKDNRFRVQSIVYAYGKLMVGDSLSGIIGELDHSTLDYYGDEIWRRSVTSPFSNQGLPIFSGDFEATFESGVGLTTGNGSNPQAALDFSDNGGRTFTGQINRPIGKIGKYGQRAVWSRQGRFPVARSIGLTVTDKVRANLIELAATPEGGY
jgi:hypothetical protein